MADKKRNERKMTGKTSTDEVLVKQAKELLSAGWKMRSYGLENGQFTITLYDPNYDSKAEGKTEE